MRSLYAVLAVAAACYTLNELRSAECNTYCRVKEGSDGGYYASGKCYCVDAREYERALQKKLVLPRKQKKKAESYPYYYED